MIDGLLTEEGEVNTSVHPLLDEMRMGTKVIGFGMFKHEHSIFFQ